MKKEISPAFVGAALIGVLAVIGLVAWRFFGPVAPAAATPEMRAEAKQWVEGFKSQARQQPGQNPAAPGAASIPKTPPPAAK